MSLTPLANGFCFGEGPRWFEGLLWFSDMLGEAVHTVDLQGDVTTLPLAGHAPSGLGFRPDGSLLIASTERRQSCATTATPSTPIADLSDVVPATSATWSSTTSGVPTSDRRHVRAASIVRVDPDGTVTVVADDLDFPNGMVITPDGDTLDRRRVHRQRRLTSFTIGADGSLSDRRVFADGLDGPPDGIALDAEGGVWAAMTLAHQFERIDRGRQGHRPHRHRRPHRDRLHARRPGAPHAVPALEYGRLSPTPGRDQTVPARRDRPSTFPEPGLSEP